MASLIVRDLEDDVRDRLRALAAAHGRSMEEEVRHILRAAALRARRPEAGLGTRTAELFRGQGFTEPIREHRGHPVRPADFDRPRG